ncbi:YcxB family protein [Marinilactibacillus psychrotolerans]|uniref:YcxB family protein n=2 Tax=Marinilactibacillus psychrotolerans TaxID=191770 RepID=A0A5R9BUJ0_9LACT|nr:YcxB family protein [Marinilactibacillus psychrotolerans]TLQ04354.1 YcxB family protein [Marinilactibacillus psychrotolerans]GEQ33776.1 hypothetical protein B795N_16580 [Marinilactibacillus psychrotolerans]SJN19789.1 hypothetical protein FM115_01315 [Marinilactibacillus psychrotolerans 42ea]
MKEENKQIVFTGALSLDDLYKATRYHWIIRRKYPLTYLGIMVSVMSFILYNAFKDESTSQQSAIIWTAFTVAIGLIGGIIALYFLIKKRTKTLYELSPSAGKEATHSANDLGIKIEMINEVVQWYEWSDVFKSYEFSDMFLVYVNPIVVIYIPKYFFETPEDVKDFSTLLLQKTKFRTR